VGLLIVAVVVVSGLTHQKLEGYKSMHDHMMLAVQKHDNNLELARLIVVLVIRNVTWIIRFSLPK
jgi:hypothetical protein